MIKFASRERESLNEIARVVEAVVNMQQRLLMDKTSSVAGASFAMRVNQANGESHRDMNIANNAAAGKR